MTVCCSFERDTESRECADSGVGSKEVMVEAFTIGPEFVVTDADTPELSDGTTGGEATGGEDMAGDGSAGEACSGEVTYRERPGV